MGGGPTGVELAGAISEIARHSLKHDFRSIDPTDASVVLVEAGPKVLSAFGPSLAEKAVQSIHRLGIDLRLNSMVTQIGPDFVELKTPRGSERIATQTVLWAAGVQASPLAKELQRITGCSLDRAGRVVVENDLTIAGHSDIFVIGDMASCMDLRCGKLLPGVAPVAIQQGKYAARTIARPPQTVPRQAVSISQPRLDGDDRQSRGSRRPWLGQVQRLPRLALVAHGAFDADRQLPQSAVGVVAVGLELFDVRPFGAANHGDRPRNGSGFIFGLKRSGVHLASQRVDECVIFG